MGNWMTVNIRGSMAAEDVAPARAHLTVADDYSNFGPLSFTEGLAGLGVWPERVINADGNLAERDYDTESVAEALRELVKVAPSLALKVHCGGDYEATRCSATITVADGVVVVGEPEVKGIGPGQ